MGDEPAIRDLVDRYCDAVRRADLDAFGACWSPEGRWTGPGLACEGIYAITSTFGKLRARVASADPQVVTGAATIEPDGVHATGWWDIREHIVSRDGSERDTIGRYDDEYVRTRTSWRFARRQFTPN